MTIRADAAANRQHILDTAYTLFKRDGFHATGMDRVIAEATIAKMTLYRHFPTKKGLIVAVLGWRAERFSRQLDRILEPAGSAERKVAAIFDWYERWVQSAGFVGCLFQHALAEYGDPGHPVFEAATSQKTALERRLAEILKAEMSAADASHTATGLLMLIEGATLLAQAGRGAAAIRDARRAALKLISVTA